MACLIGHPSDFDALFDQRVVGVAAIDPATGRVLDINARGAEIFAATADG